MAKPTKELNILKEHLWRNHLKLTRQRENILTSFLKMEHVTAEHHAEMTTSHTAQVHEHYRPLQHSRSLDDIS